MRIIAISDIHGLYNDFVDFPTNSSDLLICGGDLTNCGEKYQIQQFCEWIKLFNCKKCITIGGNHDFCLSNYLKSEMKQIFKDNGVIYLEDQEITISGIKFYGSPITPTFFNWAFMADRGEQIARYWSNIPVDTDVLVTHGPPHSILDLTYYDKENAGCEELKKRIDQLSNLKVHIFGHIHETYGIFKKGKTLYINASTCDLKYRPVNKPIVFDIDTKTKKVTLIDL